MRFLLLIPFLALAARADDESLTAIHRIETETADRIQAKVLDPILGAGQSSVFVRLRLDVKRTLELSDRVGDGQATKITVKNQLSISTAAKTKDPESDQFDGFGFSDFPKPPYQAASSQRRTQESRQTKGVKEERITISNQFPAFRLVILHDVNVPPGKRANVRSALLAVYKSENLDLKFHPVEFSALK